MRQAVKTNFWARLKWSEILWVVTFLTANFTIAEWAQAVDKPNIAVGEFSPGKAPSKLAEDFAAMLSTSLTKTRKFNVIERGRLRDIVKEQGLSNFSGLINNGVKLGGISGVRYLVYGEITHFGKNGESFSIAGLGFTKGDLVLGVDLRVVDAQSGRTVIAESVTRGMRHTINFDFDIFRSSSGSSAVIGDLVREASTDAANLVTTTIYPMKVAAVQSDGQVIINYGEGTIQRGMVLDVFSIGVGFKDPDTGEVLGSEEHLVATVRVVETHAKYSRAKVVSRQRPGSLAIGCSVRISNSHQSAEDTSKLSTLMNSGKEAVSGLGKIIDF